MQQLSLFTSKAMPFISGLQYIPDYISIEQEKQLIDIIDTQNWLTDLKRRVQHYGYKYNYTARKITSDHYIGTIPDWLLSICKKLLEDKIFKIIPDQVIINEYLPGQGISPHIDCIPCFAEVICSLSLISLCVMEFIREEKIPMLLEPRSLVILSSESRYHWKHGIAARQVDIHAGIKIPRQRRLSITFRKIIC